MNRTKDGRTPDGRPENEISPSHIVGGGMKMLGYNTALYNGGGKCGDYGENLQRKNKTMTEL